MYGVGYEMDPKLEAFLGMSEFGCRFDISYFDWAIRKITSPTQLGEVLQFRAI